MRGKRGGGVRSRRRVLAPITGVCLALLWGTCTARALSLGNANHELGVSLMVREVVEANRSTTRERTLTRLRLTPRSRPTPWLRLVASLAASHGGPSIHARSDGFYRWREPFQNRSPALDLEEAYAEASLGRADLRLGKQRIAWGKLDRFSPTDVLNALSFTDPFLVEEGERRIGSPGVLLSLALPSPSEQIGEPRLYLTWLPMFLPFRFADAFCDPQPTGPPHCTVERWFPPAAVPPTVFAIPSGLVLFPNGTPSPPISVPLSFRVRNVVPPVSLRHASYGTRLAGRVADFDTSLYYFHGFDNQPAFLFRAWATGVPDPDPANPFQVRNLTAHTVLEPAYRTIDLVGWDLSRSFAALTLRAEMAYVFGRPFARDLRTLISDPLVLQPELARVVGSLARGAGAVPVALPSSVVTRDAVEWGVGLDLLVEGWLFLVQVNQTDVLRNRTPLLIEDVETRALASVKKALLGSRLQLYVLGGLGVESGYAYARPRVQYRWTDWLSTEIGFLWIAGSRHSTIGQYRRNDQAWVSISLDL